MIYMIEYEFAQRMKAGNDFLNDLRESQEGGQIMTTPVEGLIEQHHRDSKTLVEYATEKNHLRAKLSQQKETIRVLVEAQEALKTWSEEELVKLYAAREKHQSSDNCHGIKCHRCGEFGGAIVYLNRVLIEFLSEEVKAHAEGKTV